MQCDSKYVKDALVQWHIIRVSKPSYYYDTIIHIMTSVIRVVNRDSLRVTVPVFLIPIMTILSHYYHTIMIITLLLWHYNRDIHYDTANYY